jgi:outer membrane lipoprotein-sorting protein/DNA-binding CsgD family transcriptional regulator
MSGMRSNFAEARRHDGELNERQRQVLDLLVAGKTNGAIGEVLGISLDGAKWNVSEVLTKLGLDSREQAAEYWRWRQRGWRRLERAMRGLIGAIPLKLALGASGVALLGASALVAWLAVTGDEPPVAGSDLPGSFYMEASIVVRSDPSPQDIGRSPAEQTSPTANAAEKRFALRWWYQDVDHGRWEVDALTPSLDQRNIVVVCDGKEQWFYDSAQNTFTEDPLQPMPAGLKVRYLGLSELLDPYPASTLDEFMTALRGDRSDTHVVRAGEETMLGRKTTIVELSPATRSSTTSPGGPTTESGSGTVRFWIDTAAMFVLKTELKDDAGSGQGYVAEVTKLEAPSSIPAAKLRFQPPKGAKRTTNSDVTGGGATSAGTPAAVGGGSSTQGTVTVLGPVPKPPDGFLPFGALPTDYRVNGISQSGSGIAPSWVLDLVDGSGHHVAIDQRMRADGLPEGLKTGEIVSLPGGVLGYQATDGTTKTLAFEKDGIAVVISAEALSFGELGRIAANMLAP